VMDVIVKVGLIGVYSILVQSLSVEDQGHRVCAVSRIYSA